MVFDLRLPAFDKYIHLVSCIELHLTITIPQKLSVFSHFSCARIEKIVLLKKITQNQHHQEIRKMYLD